MKNLSTTRKWLLLAALAVTTMVGCQKEATPTAEETSFESSASIPNSKEVFGMTVVDSSIIFNTESLALLDSANTSELIFRSKPLQADSMAAGFVLVTSEVSNQLPDGLLVRSLGTTEDAEGFKVQIESIELTDYILEAELSGTVTLNEEAETTSVLPSLSSRGTAGLNNQVGSLSSSLQTGRRDPRMANINGPTIPYRTTYTLASGSTAEFELIARPSATYNISISARRRRFHMSFTGNLALNNIGLKLTARAPLGVNLTGDEVYFPIPIPIGPILITPYFSAIPYVQAQVAAVGSVHFTSSGNIAFNYTQNGHTPSGTASGSYRINKPAFELYTIGTVATGVQATFGVGLYGKVIYTQVQSKVGPKLELKNDILAKRTTVTASVPATVTASAGAKILFWNIISKDYPLLNRNLYYDQWVYDWPI